MSGILIDVNARTHDSARELNKVSDSVKNIETSTNKAAAALAALGKTIGSAFIAGGTYAVLKSVNQEFTSIQNRLSLITKDLEDLGRVEKRLAGIARDTRTSVGDTVDVYYKLSTALSRAGVSERRLMQATQALNQSIAISGGSAESASRAIIQLGQGLSAGALRGEELASVMEQMPRFAQLLAEELDISVGQLRTVAEQGKLTSDFIFTSLINNADKLGAEFAKFTPTLQQLEGALSSAFRTYVYNLDKGLGLTRGISAGVGDLTVKMRLAAESAEDLGGSIRTKVVGGIASIKSVGGPVLDFLGTLGEKVKLAVPGFFVTNTLRGETREYIRLLDDSLGGALTIIRNFRLSYLWTIESTTEKAVRAFRRLLPANWIASGGFDRQTFERIFSRKYLDAFLAVFSRFTQGLSEDSRAIRVNIATLDRDIGIVWRRMLRYFGLIPDTLVAVKTGLLSPIYGSINNILQGLTDTGVRLYEIGRLFTEIFGPALAALILTTYKVVFKLPGLLLQLVNATLAIIETMLNRLKLILEEAFGSAEILTAAAWLLKDMKGQFLDLAFTLGFTMKANRTFFDTFVDTINAGTKRVLRSLGLLKESSLLDFDFSGISRSVRRFTRDFIGYFRDLYDEVIGHSWWTDTVEGIKSGVEDVEEYFRDFGSVVRDASKVFIPLFAASGLLGGMFRQLKAGLRDLPKTGRLFALALLPLQVGLKSALGLLGQLSMAVLVFGTLIPAAFAGMYFLHKFFPDMEKLAREKLASAADYVERFAERVIGYFEDIYEDVIGGSWWTDTIDSVKSDSKSLWNSVAPDFMRFKTGVSDVFAEIYRKAKSGRLSLDVIGLKDVRRVDVGELVQTQPVVKAVVDVFQKIRAVAQKVFETFPSLLQVSLQGAGLVLVNSLFEPGLIRASLSAALGGAMLPHLAVIGERLGLALFGESLLEVAAKKAGKFVALVISNIGTELPEIINALGAFFSGLGRGLLENLPLSVGKVFQSIFQVLDKYTGLSGPLGIFGAFLFGKTIKDFFKVTKGAKGGVEGLFETLQKFMSSRGKNWGAIGEFLYGGPGPVRIVAGLTSIASALGAFDSVLSKAPFTKLMLDTASLFLLLTGNRGLDKITSLFAENVTLPLKNLLTDQAKKFLAGPSLAPLFDALFGGDPSQSVSTRAIKFGQAAIDVFIKKSIEAATSLGGTFGGKLMQLIFGPEWIKTLDMVGSRARGLWKNTFRGFKEAAKDVRSGFGRMLADMSFLFNRGVGTNLVSSVTSALDKINSRVTAMSARAGPHGLLGNLLLGKNAKWLLGGALLGGLALLSTAALAKGGQGSLGDRDILFEGFNERVSALRSQETATETWLRKTKWLFQDFLDYALYVFAAVEVAWSLATRRLFGFSRTLIAGLLAAVAFLRKAVPALLSTLAEKAAAVLAGKGILGGLLYSLAALRGTLAGAVAGLLASALGADAIWSTVAGVIVGALVQSISGEMVVALKDVLLKTIPSTFRLLGNAFKQLAEDIAARFALAMAGKGVLGSLARAFVSARGPLTGLVVGFMASVFGADEVWSVVAGVVASMLAQALPGAIFKGIFGALGRILLAIASFVFSFKALLLGGIGLVALLLFGKDNPIETLKDIWAWVGKITGLWKTAPKNPLGMSEAAYQANEQLSLGVGYDLSRVNLGKIGAEEKKQFEEKRKELEETILKAKKEDYFEGAVTEATRQEILNQNRAFNKFVEKLAQRGAKDFNEITQEISNGFRKLERVSLVQRFLSGQFEEKPLQRLYKRDIEVLRDLQSKARDSGNKDMVRFYQQEINRINAAFLNKSYSAEYRPLSSQESRIDELIKKARVVKTEDPEIIEEVTRALQRYQAVQTEINKQAVNWKGFYDPSKVDPQLLQTYDLYSSAAEAALNRLVEFDRRAREASAFAKDIAEIQNRLQQGGISLDTKELFVSGSPDLDRIREISREVERLSKRLKQVRSAEERNEILIKLAISRENIEKIAEDAKRILRSSLSNLELSFSAIGADFGKNTVAAVNRAGLAAETERIARDIATLNELQLEAVDKAVGKIREKNLVVQVPELNVWNSLDLQSAVTEGKLDDLIAAKSRELDRAVTGAFSGREGVSLGVRDIATRLGFTVPANILLRKTQAEIDALNGQIMELNDLTSKTKFGDATGPQIVRMEELRLSIQDALEPARTLSDMMSDLSSGGFSFTLEDMVKLGDGTLEDLRKLSTELYTVNKLMSRENSKNLSFDELRALAERQKKALRELRAEYEKTLNNTPSKVLNNAREVVGDSYRSMLRIGESDLRKLSELGASRQRTLSRTDDRGLTATVRDMARIERQFERAKTLVMSSVEDIAGLISNVFETQIPERALLEISPRLRGAMTAAAKYFDLVMKDIKASDVFTEDQMRSVFQRLDRISAGFRLQGILANYRADLERMTYEGARAGFERVSSVIKDLQLEFEDYVGLSAKQRAFFQKQAAAIKTIGDVFESGLLNVTDELESDPLGLARVKEMRALLADATMSPVEVLERLGPLFEDHFRRSLESLNESPEAKQIMAMENLTDAVKHLEDAFRGVSRGPAPAVGYIASPAAPGVPSETAGVDDATIQRSITARTEALRGAVASGVESVYDAFDAARLKLAKVGVSLDPEVLYASTDAQLALLSSYADEIDAKVRAIRFDKTLPEETRRLYATQAEALRFGLSDLVESLDSGRKNFLGAGRRFVEGIEGSIKQSFADLFRARKQDESIGIFRNFLNTVMDGVTNAIIDQFIDGFIQGIKETAGKGLVEAAGKEIFSAGAGLVKGVFGLFSGAGAPGGEAMGTGAAPGEAEGSVDQTGALAPILTAISGFFSTMVFGQTAQTATAQAQLAATTASTGLITSAIYSSTSMIVGAILSLQATTAVAGVFASGGPVSGPGTPTSDSIPAMLSDGEFVVNAAQTKRFLPLLTAINAGSIRGFSDGGMVTRRGEAVRPVQSGGSRASPVIVNLNITGDVSRQTRMEVMQMLPRIAEGVNVHNKEKGYKP
jgi:tape measure domain-containing protein